MAITYSDYTGDGSNTDFAFSFPYLEDTHVVVEVDGVDKTTTAGDFTLPTTSLARMTVAPADGALVRVKRVSDFATDLVDFTNGSVLTEGDLDRAYQHNRYLNEEAAEGNDASMQIVGGGTDFNAANKKIVNLATPTASLDATNKNYVDDRVTLSASNLNAFDKSTHTGDNTETEFTLSFTSQTDTDEAYLVTIDGVVQTPTTAYGVNSTTNKITFTSAPPTSANIVVVPIGMTTDLTESLALGVVTATGSTTARKLTERFADVANVLDYGAVADGATDDTTAIQAAINSSSSIVYIPAGTYAVTSLDLKSNVKIYGDGRDSTILKQVLTTSPSSRYSVFEPSAGYSNVEVADLGLDGNYTANNSAGRYSAQTGDGVINGIGLRNLTNSRFINLDIKDFYTDGIYVGKVSGSPSGQTPTNNVIQGCRISGRRNGIVVAQADTLRIVDCEIYDVNQVSPYTAIDIEPFEDTDCKHLMISDVVIRDCIRGIGIVTKAPLNAGWTYGTNCVVNNVFMEEITGTSAISVHGFNDVKISNINVFHSTPSGASNQASILIGQTRRCTVNGATIVNPDYAGVRVLDAFSGDVNHVDSIVRLTDINVVNPYKHGVSVGNEFGDVAGNRITAQVTGVDVTAGSNTQATGYGFLLGDINPNYVSLINCTESSGTFAYSIWLYYSSSVLLPVIGCDLKNAFATNDGTTTQPFLDHVVLSATTILDLLGSNNSFFGGKMSVANASAQETVRLDGTRHGIRYLQQNVAANMQNESLFVDSVTGKLSFKDSTGTTTALY